MPQELRGKAKRTRERMLLVALELFERQGYRATTVSQIADAAGVTSMTFFRHFPTKDSVLVTDPYDPLIAEAVGAQPPELPALERVRLGFLSALDGITPTEDATARRRVAVAAELPELRGALAASTQATQDAVVATLVAQGVDALDAAVVTAACLGAISAALFAWSALPAEVSLDAVVRRALGQLAPGQPR
ncbi:MAG: TetR family transcriptional regulator [Micropruina sp.]|uniref:TetR/AcrR family transcriptional regulator n=1 Tax=Micropruina sp. TaxID=2737536 RepID=UPI0039E590A9